MQCNVQLFYTFIHHEGNNQDKQTETRNETETEKKKNKGKI